VIVARALFLVMVQMAAGALPWLAAVRADDLGPGYFRAMAVSILSLALAGAWVAPVPERLASAAGVSWLLLAAFVIALALYALALMRRDAKPHSPLFALACGLGLAHVALEGVATPVAGRPAAIAPASFLVAATVLGLAFTGMMLGHWYLTSPSIPLAPLRRCARGFLASILVHAALVLGLTALAILDPDGPLRPALALATFQDVLAWMRLAVGIAGPIVLAVMIDQTAKLGSNMSTTGLFYLALAQVTAGELIARVLLVRAGVLF
jgi:hypothetical protein